MATVKSVYQGGLRTRATHLQSGNSIVTDAPTDNQGRGEAFSPTDLVAAALGSCMMTIMGIVANREGIDLEGVDYETTKIMVPQPRKIAEIQVDFTFPEKGYTGKQQQMLENAARTCPVALSIHPDIKQTIRFYWSEE